MNTLNHSKSNAMYGSYDFLYLELILSLSIILSHLLAALIICFQLISVWYIYLH